MAETPGGMAQTPLIQQTDFEKITQLVSAHFQSEESLMEHGIPTYYLKQPQETKRAFLDLLKSLESIGMIAFLRKIDGRVVLKVVPKPEVKPSNILVNWILLLATIGTTFVTGYVLSVDFGGTGLMSSPFVGAALFSVAIMTVLGGHEMGHKLTANRNRIDATPPYFIPGPPPIGEAIGLGTFGAVIMQKSLPPNRDALFDVGSSGPIVGFILALIASVVGLLYSPISPSAANGLSVPAPLIFEIIGIFIARLPERALHPVAFAGWAGMVVTMLNLLPVAQLDGGHAARSLLGERGRTVLTILSVLLLVVTDFWPMAIFVFFMSMYRHPGPLDDVSRISNGRKLLAVGLVVIFVLSSYIHYWVLNLLGLLGI